MKILITTLAVMSIASTTFANNSQIVDISKESTYKQQGFDRHENQSTECNYRSYRFSTNDETYVLFGIEIASDHNTFINGHIQFEEKDLPLRNGAIFSRAQEEANYKNGILKYKATQSNGPLSVLVTEIELDVSPDLKEIISINLKKTVRPLVGPNKVDTKLNCQF